MLGRRIFWPLIALASLLEALASASLAAAVFSIELPPGISVYGYSGAVFGRITNLDWSADGPWIVAAVVLAVFGFATYVVAARAR